MTYQETLDFMFAQLPMYHRVGAAAYKADIQPTIDLMAALGNPERKFKSIHVAGTNGKGSVSHMLASILQEAGYKVPEQIAVCGYDDYAGQERADMALTTYHVNVEEMISQCMNMLEQHCENPDYRYGTVLSYGWLVERRTGRYHGK